MTGYEMGISGWSSDVGSSDLVAGSAVAGIEFAGAAEAAATCAAAGRRRRCRQALVRARIDGICPVRETQWLRLRQLSQLHSIGGRKASERGGAQRQSPSRLRDDGSKRAKESVV